MSERFERIFSLSGNLYAENSPLIISAGALLKDTETERILAQLKFKSISPETIKAIKVKITPMDTIGKPIGNEVLFDYLDLNEKRDAEFGQKKAIPMPNPATRSFMAEVTEVAFANNTVWEASENAWNSLDTLVPLEQAIEDREIVKQYQIRFGPSAKYQPQKDNRIWRCTCGAINDAEEKICHSCACAEKALFSCDYEELKAEATVRIEREREEEKKKAKKKKKISTIIFSCAIACFACIAVFVLITKVLIPNSKYNQAVALFEDGQYEAAVDAFEALGDYKDSAFQAFEAQRGIVYDAALSYENNGEFEKAIATYSTIPDFKDTTERMEVCQEAIYTRANELQSEEQYDEAIIEYNKIIEYKDSRDRIAKCAIIQELLQISKANVGDIVSLGSFEQDNDLETKDEPIQWIVVEKEGNRCLLLSKACLYGGEYTSESKSGSANFWENSTIRKWLNSEFYSSAFNDIEKKTILLSTLVNKGYSYEARYEWESSYTTEDGNNTNDRVFLLSMEEIETYLVNNPDLLKYLSATVTRYAGHGLGKDNVYGYGTAGSLWTRTSGHDSVLCMDFPYKDKTKYSIFYSRGYRWEDDKMWSPGVRPAIWLDLSACEELLRE